MVDLITGLSAVSVFCYIYIYDNKEKSFDVYVETVDHCGFSKQWFDIKKHYCKYKAIILSPFIDCVKLANQHSSFHGNRPGKLF